MNHRISPESPESQKTGTFLKKLGDGSTENPKTRTIVVGVGERKTYRSVIKRGKPQNTSVHHCLLRHSKKDGLTGFRSWFGTLRDFGLSCPS